MWKEEKDNVLNECLLAFREQIKYKESSFQLQQDLTSAKVSVDFSTVRRWLLAVGRKARQPIEK